MAMVKSEINNPQVAEKTHVQAGFQVQRTTFAGPLPPPTLFAEYDRIVPGGAERLLKMAENQSEHRQLLEKSVIKSDIKKSYLGVIFGFLIGMTGLCLSGYVILHGHDLAGSALGGTSLISLVSVFVYGKRGKEKELAHKR